MKFWPWTTKVIERGREEWIQRNTLYGYVVGEPQKYIREVVVYETTNHITGSVTIRKKYLN